EGDTSPDRKLHYAGNVGSGFNDAMLAKVDKLLRDTVIEKSPFDGPTEGKVTFVEPRLIAQVKFTEITKDGRLRAPVFLGLRDDVAPADVRREEAVAIEDVALEEPEAEESSNAGSESEAMPRGSARGTAKSRGKATKPDSDVDAAASARKSSK